MKDFINIFIQQLGICLQILIIMKPNFKPPSYKSESNFERSFCKEKPEPIFLISISSTLIGDSVNM